ncbi:MAG: glycosyltransferase family 4 protein [Gemmatimonadaceae bacterium]|nr:glycosyltransferase family 4 protein [Gemmatimonadaceae bacterium]
MTMTILLLHGAVLVLATTLARFAFLTAATTASSDNVGSVRVTEAQRRSRWLSFDVSNSVFPGTYGYPPLVFWLVSRLPRRLWTRGRYWANYLADTASALLVWAAIRVLAPALPGEVALLAALGFGLNPLLLPTVDHARITAPNARSFGLLLNTLWILLLVACVARGDAWLAAVLVPLTWLIILTSQFGMQTMFGVTTLVSLLSGNWWPTAAMFVATLVGCAIPGLGVWAVLHHKFAHWRWYRRVQRTIVNVVSLRAMPVRTRVAAFLRLLAHPVRDGHALGHAFQTSPWWKMLAGVLPLVVALALALSNRTVDAALADPVARALAQVSLAAGILFVLTLLPPLLFLGEAERYVEHCLAAIVVLAVLLVAAVPSLALTATVLGFSLVLAVTVAQLAHRQWPAAQAALHYPQVGFGEERALLSALVRRGSPVRIATVPVKAAFLLHDLLIDSAEPGSERVEFLFQHTLQQGDDHFAYLLEDTTDGYTYLRGELDRLVSRYGINFMLVETALLRDAGNREPILEALRLRTPVHSGRFTLYSLHDVAAAPAPAVPVAAPVPLPAEHSMTPPGTVPAHAGVPVPAPRPAPRPRILAIADVPDWIFERHVRTLQVALQDEFEIVLHYHTMPFDEDAFDLVYAMEFGLVPTAQIRSPWKYVTAVRSHVSWENVPAEQLAHYLRAHFQRTHVVSRRLQRALSPWLPDVAYVTHGIDGERFRPVVREGRTGTIRVGWAGNRNTATKGFADFIAPLAALPGVELVFCGYADRNLTLDEMPAFYSSIDAYVCTSQTEGNNNSLLEAAATGAAIVTTEAGTVPEYLVDGESALVVRREPVAFADAVLRLRDDPALRARLGRAASAAVIPAWTWACRAEDYRLFLRAAVDGREAARLRMREVPPLTTLSVGGAPPFDLAAAVDAVQLAVGEGRVEDALSWLAQLAVHDASNPVWPSLIEELGGASRAA